MRKKKTKGKIIGHTESITFLNGIYLGKSTSPIYVYTETKEDWDKAIGIGLMNPAYIEVNKLQEKEYEYTKIRKFLYEYMSIYAKRKGIDQSNLHLEFINYGKTELVYVLTEPSGERLTILVKQPAVEFGKVMQEADNLKNLKKFDKNVVAPIDYFKFGDQELYVTPYINQARCVASYGRWGMYVPEPYYRFEEFTEYQRQIVNICMIAKLVSLYNFEKGEGVASCKLGGGDFMLPKGWETKFQTIESTLESLYLIAAREMIKCPFEDYLNIIRMEFSRSTIEENQDDLLINLRARVPMDPMDIENGIELGKKIILQRNIQHKSKSSFEDDEQELN